MSESDRFRFEQHIGTIMQIMVEELLAWSLKSNVELTTQMGIVQAKIEYLQATVSQGTSDQYHSTDAAKDMSAIWSEFSRYDVRINKLENKTR
jgi:hypothetical protein